MAKDISEFPIDFNPETYKQEAEALGEEVAEALGDGFVKGLYKSDINVTRAFQTKYTSLNYQLEFGLISQEEYFEKLEQIRDSYFSKNSQEWYKYTLEIYEYRVNTLKEYEQAVRETLAECAKSYEGEFSEIAAGAEAMIERIAKARDSYEQKLKSYAGSGKGFDTHRIVIDNYYPTGDPVVIIEHELSDLEGEIKELEAFQETITALTERGESINPEAFRALFEEMRTLSVEDANTLANLLLEADDETFSAYLEAYQKRQELTGDIATSLYEDDFKIAAADLKAEIEKQFSEIPEEFFTYGEMTAENFKAGFEAGIMTLFEDVAALLGDYGFTLNGDKNPTVDGNSYVTTYYISGSGETTTEQLIGAQNHSDLQRLRTGTTD